MEKNKEYIIRVTAVNEIGKSKPSEPSEPMKLKKPEVKEPPTIMEALKSLVVARKQTVTLSCVIRGTPKPEITWYKNDKPFKSKNVTFEDCVAKFEVTEAKETTAGIYKVHAKNDAGEAETTCTVRVQEPPELDVDDAMTSQKLRVTNQWKVIVNYKGYPQPEVKWKKNSREIFSEKHCSIYTDDTSSTIAIYSLTRDDSDVYEVTAENAAGSSSLQLNLKVIGERQQNVQKP